MYSAADVTVNTVPRRGSAAALGAAGPLLPLRSFRTDAGRCDASAAYRIDVLIVVAATAAESVAVTPGSGAVAAGGHHGERREWARCTP